MNVIDEDHIEDLFMTSTHNYIMFFTNKGRVYRLKGYEIPESSRTARGVNIINLLQLQPEEKITAIIPLSEDGRVSKKHCVIVHRGDKLYLKDEGSRNGTYLNGEAVTRPVVIQKDDVIGLGGTRLEILNILRESE